jgi:hypothetical protein
MLFSKPKIRPLTFSPEEIVCLQSATKRNSDDQSKGRYFSESMDAGKNPGAIHPVLKCPYGQTGDRIWVRETARSEWQRTLESPSWFRRGYSTALIRNTVRSPQKRSTKCSQLKHGQLRVIWPGNASWYASMGKPVPA